MANPTSADLLRMMPSLSPEAQDAVRVQMGKIAAKQNKYGVAPKEQRTFDNMTFASKAEMIRYQQLCMLRDSKAIRGFDWQMTFHLGCKENSYRVDFLVWGNDGQSWAEDVKGKETTKFRHDVKLWRAYGPCPLHIRKRSGQITIIEQERHRTH